MLIETARYGVKSRWSERKENAVNPRAIIGQLSTVAGASLATACCWVPLTLAVAGVTATGLSQTLEQWSAFFYALTGALIVYSFWEGFLRAPRSCDGDDATDECQRSSGGRSRQMRIFFVVHLALVALILSAPTLMMSSSSSASASAAELATVEDADQDLASITLEIEGMTCGGCVANIERALQDLKGMHHVSVSYKDSKGVMTFDDKALASSEIVARISDEGYDVAIVESDTTASFKQFSN